MKKKLITEAELKVENNIDKIITSGMLIVATFLICAPIALFYGATAGGLSVGLIPLGVVCVGIGCYFATNPISCKELPSIEGNSNEKETLLNQKK